jgi:hypothetical protein
MPDQPKPPTLHALAKTLREQHEACSHPDAGGEFFALDFDGERWCLIVDDNRFRSRGGFGREYVPGDGRRFDAMGAARRMLAAVRDAYDQGFQVWESRHRNA